MGAAFTARSPEKVTAKAADLPIPRSTKLELAINLNTARRSACQVPASLLDIADEVIE